MTKNGQKIKNNDLIQYIRFMAVESFIKILKGYTICSTSLRIKSRFNLYTGPDLPTYLASADGLQIMRGLQ